jgi:hypothetical protein
VEFHAREEKKREEIQQQIFGFWWRGFEGVVA